MLIEILENTDSAAGSAKSARTNAFQAIMPLRGKVLNTEKITETKAMENKEISTLINVIGTGIKEYCDYKKSRYGKIILLTDADVDGSHIDILILTFLYKYMRPLIEQGMVYLAVPPLYRVRKGNKYKYLKNEEELDEYRKHNSNFEIQRFKGLGEMDADQLWETTMNPETRVLKQITIQDIQEAGYTIGNLMGKDVAPRKNILIEKGNTVELNI